MSPRDKDIRALLVAASPRGQGDSLGGRLLTDSPAALPPPRRDEQGHPEPPRGRDVAAVEDSASTESIDHRDAGTGRPSITTVTGRAGLKQAGPLNVITGDAAADGHPGPGHWPCSSRRAPAARPPSPWRCYPPPARIRTPKAGRRRSRPLNDARKHRRNPKKLRRVIHCLPDPARTRALAALASRASSRTQSTQRAAASMRKAARPVGFTAPHQASWRILWAPFGLLQALPGLMKLLQHPLSSSRLFLDPHEA